MECTILEFQNGRRELYYGRQELSGLKNIPEVYEVPEDKIELIRTCKTEEVQAVLSDLVKTCKKVK